MASTFVDTGDIAVLTALATTYGSYRFRLFTNDETITESTVVGDLTEAAWSGYSAPLLGLFSSASIVGGKAKVNALSNPNFTNSSGSPVTFYGWFVTNYDGTVLIAAENIGETEIPAGEGYLFALAATFGQDPA